MKKTILVTGGNRGIGKEICRQLTAMGHQVLLGSRSVEKGKAAAESMEGNVEVVQIDVTLPEQIEALAAHIETKYGQLDVLINNSGIGIGSSGASDINLNEARSVIETNFFGVWQSILILLPLLKKSSDARIVNMSSGMGSISEMVHRTGYAGYRISKSALNALSILLSNELKGEVKVNSMCPGWVRTDMGGPEADRSVEEGADTAVWLATADKTPNGKFLRDRQVIEW